MGPVGVFGAAGAVGSATAFALALGGARRLVLVDAAAAPLAAQRMDLEMLSAAVPGLELATGGPAALAGCEVVVACAAVPHRDGAPRAAFLEANAAIVAQLAEALDGAAASPDVVLVSNPVDALATWLQRRLGARARVVGHGLNDSLRLRVAIARCRRCAPASVEAWSLGEHGPHAVPLLGRVRVGGAPAALTAGERARVLDELGGWYERWQRLGTGRTSAWTTAWGAAALVRALRRGERGPWPVSTLLRGEYGVEGVCLTVPVAFGPGRARRVLTWELAAREREAIARAAAAVADAVAAMRPRDAVGGAA